MVSRGVHVYGGDPLAPTHELLHHPLLYQVVHLHCCLSCHEEERSGGVEGKALHSTWCPGEGALCLTLRELGEEVRRERKG